MEKHIPQWQRKLNKKEEELIAEAEGMANEWIEMCRNNKSPNDSKDSLHYYISREILKLLKHNRQTHEDKADLMNQISGMATEIMNLNDWARRAREELEIISSTWKVQDREEGIAIGKRVRMESIDKLMQSDVGTDKHYQKMHRILNPRRGALQGQ